MDTQTRYRMLTQQLVVSGLRTLLENQIKITEATYPSFNGRVLPFKLLEIGITPENPRVPLDINYLSFVCAMDLTAIGSSGKVFEGKLKNETVILTIHNEALV
ncbi:hypothetical protein N9165_00285 [Akkermansiaceae bacterium]|nr:hypothetical protein [Akkermansiaceae bacterium]